jgi:endonuclease-3 related protein
MQKKLLKLYKQLYRVYGPQHWWPAKTRLEVIIGAVLTQNTAWLNAEKAIANLASQNLLSPLSLKNVRKKKLASLIKPSGYYNIKADRLKSFIIFLFKKYSGSLNKMFLQDIQSLRQELLNVKGLGRETVDSILLYAGKKPVFVVDAYTKRILLRHEAVPPNSDGYLWIIFLATHPSLTNITRFWLGLQKIYAKRHPNASCALQERYFDFRLDNLIIRGYTITTLFLFFRIMVYEDYR